MNDNVEHTPGPHDQQMDLLLQAFYKKEMPDALDIPPSQWAQLQTSEHPAAESTAVRSTASVTTQTASPRTAAPRTAARSVAVVAATLAMALMVMVFSQSVPDSVPSQADSAGGRTDLMNVSEAPNELGSGVISEDRTTLEEIDAIDLQGESTRDETTKP